MFSRTSTIRSITQTQRSSSSTTNDESTPSIPLNIVSWNISSAQPSQAAPNPTQRFQNASRLIREEVLRSNPDIIALQETGSPERGGEIFPMYRSLGTKVVLHTWEYVDLLIRREAFSNVEVIAFPRLPAVGALLTYRGTKLIVVSIHLPHTKEAAPLRKRLCRSILQCVETCDADDIILIGDFNMRKDEDTSIEQMAGGLTDAWKEVTNSDKKKMFTWNGHENMYHGPDSFKFTARFDRCYVRGGNIRLREFDLIGNQTIEGSGDYLSDHYGLFVKCDVAVSDASSSSNKTQSSSIRSMSDVSSGASANQHAGNTLNAAQNARSLSTEELRRLRLQRFESNTTSNTSRNEIVDSSIQCNNVVDLTENSDDDRQTQRAIKKARGTS
jgi:endonuclease/exonuclease/phosphatase family metal-dependent hydrolase